MRLNRRAIQALAVMALVMSAVACQQEAASEPQSEVTSSSEALAAAIAECGQAFGRCSAEARGDADARDLCRDTLTQCLDDTRPAPGGPRGEDSDAGVDVDGDNGDDDNGDGDDENDAGNDGAGQGDGNPAADRNPAQEIGGCVDSLLACLEGGEAPMTCGRQVRECVVSAVPAPAGAIPELPEDPGPPSGRPEPPDHAGAPDAAAPDTPATDRTACMQQFADCRAGGGEAQSCARAQRDCLRQ